MHTVLKKQQEYVALGAMSGSSLDGLDLALVRLRPVGETRFEFLKATTLAYPAALTERLRHAELLNGRALTELNVTYSHFLGKALRDFLSKCDLQPQIIGLHGHTLFHAPTPTERAHGYSLQLGCGQTIAAYLHVPLVTDFRAQDIALGGQGAPLVPAGERALFVNTRAFVNLGGIANIGLHPPFTEQPERVLGYDLAGCNQILNRLARAHDLALSYDEGGRIAATGQLHPPLLEALDTLDYYRQPPPKSLGNADLAALCTPEFERFTLPPADQLHTFCAHLGWVIARALPQLPNGLCEPLLVTGGGAHNRFLMAHIRQAISA
ncbi:MAG: anhydro-N-acetylmuramic acid kinase, partial [Bacteroidota bacterium]